MNPPQLYTGKRGTAYLRLTVSMLIFGSIGLVARSSPLPAAQLVLVRAAVGSAVLASALALALLPARKKSQVLHIARLRAQWPLLAVSGAAMGLNWVLLFEAYRYTSMASATVAYYCAPVFVLLASPFVLKEALTPARLACAGCAVIGVALVAGEGFSAANQTYAQAPRGIALALGAAALYACVMVLNKRLQGLGSLETALAQMLAATLVTAVYVALFVQQVPLGTLNAPQLAGALLLGVVHTGVAYLLFFSAVPHLSAQTAAMLSYVDPVTAILLSVLVVREPMTLLQAAGAALILGATFAGEWRARKCP